MTAAVSPPATGDAPDLARLLDPAESLGDGPSDDRVPLDAAVVVCCRKDYWQLRVCVASLAHWHPDLPILLLKDHAQGGFDTSELERHFGVRNFPATWESFGSPLSKLDVLFKPGRKRYLVLDSDTALLGPVADRLERYAADIVVSPAPTPRAEIPDAYYDPDKLAAMDPDFRFPGYVFNTGQLVVTSGVLTPADFAEVVDWKNRPANLRKDVFPLNDQPRLNYVVQKLSAAGRVSVDGFRFKVNPETETADVTVEQLRSKDPACPAAVMHWMGRGEVVGSRMPRGDVFLFYEREFFRRVGRAPARPVFAAGRRARKTVLAAFPKSLRGRARRRVLSLLGRGAPDHRTRR